MVEAFVYLVVMGMYKMDPNSLQLHPRFASLRRWARSAPSLVASLSPHAARITERASSSVPGSTVSKDGYHECILKAEPELFPCVRNKYVRPVVLLLNRIEKRCSLVWLATMSAPLAKRTPNPIPFAVTCPNVPMQKGKLRQTKPTPTVSQIRLYKQRVPVKRGNQIFPSQR